MSSTKTFTVDGKTMSYQDIGCGPVIVFGHNYLWDGQMWAEQVALLSQSYRCIVPDFWSHGCSDSAPASMGNFTDYARHIIALLVELNIE